MHFLRQFRRIRGKYPGSSDVLLETVQVLTKKQFKCAYKGKYMK
jgi:hypothetical protein